MGARDEWVSVQVKSALKQLQRQWGGGWALLGAEIQSALLAQKVLAVIGGQHIDSYTDAQKAKAIHTLIELANAGLGEIER